MKTRKFENLNYSGSASPLNFQSNRAKWGAFVDALYDNDNIGHIKEGLYRVNWAMGYYWGTVVWDPEYDTLTYTYDGDEEPEEYDFDSLDEFLNDDDVGAKWILR